MSSGGIPPNDDPGPEEILEALQEAITNNPRFDDMPVEEIARQLVLEGHLEQEPPLELVEDTLDSDDSAELPPPYFLEDGRGLANMELERCDACGLPSDSLGELEGIGCATGATRCFGRLRCSEKALFLKACYVESERFRVVSN